MWRTEKCHDDIINSVILGIDDSAIVCGVGMCIASATAPAATLMVIRQYKAEGPVTNILMPVVALDDAIGLIVFSISLSIAKLTLAVEGVNPLHILLDPLKEIALSLIIGAVLFCIIPEKFLFAIKERLYSFREKQHSWYHKDCL